MDYLHIKYLTETTSDKCSCQNVACMLFSERGLEKYGSSKFISKILFHDFIILCWYFVGKISDKQVSYPKLSNSLSNAKASS